MKDRSDEGKSGLGKPQVKIVHGKPGSDKRKQSVLDVPREMKISTGKSND